MNLTPEYEIVAEYVTENNEAPLIVEAVSMHMSMKTGTYYEFRAAHGLIEMLVMHGLLIRTHSDISHYGEYHVTDLGSQAFATGIEKALDNAATALWLRS